MKHDSFTQNVKNEIALFDYDKKQYRALLSGFIKTNGVINISANGINLFLKTENSKIAKLIYQAFVVCYQVTPAFSYSQKMKLDKCVVYNLLVENNVEEILKDLEIMEDLNKQTPRHILNGDGIRYFLSGVFLASGSVNSPSSSNYHLQIIVSTLEDVKFLIRILNRFKDEKTMEFKYIARKNKYLVYLKKADQISVFLAIINAPDSMLSFENARIEKDFVNSDNRVQNCYNANFQKVINKANQQLEDIRIIKEKNEFIHLSKSEQELANARVNNPEGALSFLVKELEKQGISISKASASRIFNKLHDLANCLRSK